MELVNVENLLRNYTSGHCAASRFLVAGVLLTAATVARPGRTVAVDFPVRPVRSDSVRPTFRAGDVTVTSAVPTSRPKPGDMIVFQLPKSR
jgi:signal peptidase I